MKIKAFAVFLAACFFAPLASCGSDTAEPNHITFENSADSEIQIMKTLYTEFEPYILLRAGEAVSKDIEWEGGGFQLYFIFDSLKYCASLYPAHSRWFSIIFSENESGEVKCTYKWKNWDWGKTYTEDMYIKKIEE